MQIKLQPLQLVNVYQRAINQFMRGRAWTPNDTARALREATSHTYLSNTPNGRKPCPPVTIEVSAFGGIQASESVQAGQSGQPQPMPPQPQAQGPQPPNPSAPQKPVAPAGEASQTALIAFIDELQTMASLPEGSPERDQAEQRADLLWEMIRNGDDDGEGAEEDDNGEQTAALKEALSRVPFDVFTHVYHLDNGPWQPFKGPRGGIGWKNSQTGRVLYTNATEAPGSRRRTQQASGERAKVIGDRVMSHYQNPEEHHAPDENELQELATHLPKMTAQHLQQLRGRLMASFKHGKRQSQMVEALKAHVDHLVKNKQEHGALFPEAQKGAAIADAKEEAKAAKSPKPGTVKMLSTDEMHVDPERFQFKMNTNKEGVTDELKGVQTFNPDLAGIISVWHDPADGKTYVVNGHHRAELAKRTGHPHLAVRYINAPNSTEARAKGALINIAEGRGTAVDAAKFMRDMDLKPEDLATHGISLKGALARDAGHLRGLADPLFAKVARGHMDTDRAVALGKHLNGKEDLQLQLANFIDRKEEATGREWTPKMVAEAAEEVAHAPTTTKDDGGLFGGTTEESRLEERAALKSHVRGELAKAQRDFEAVASDRRAGAVKEAGNVLNVEENKKHAVQHAQDAEVFAKLAHYKGPMSDLINQAAEEYANVPKSKRRQIETNLVGQVRDLIHRGGATGTGDQGGGVVGQGSAGATGAGSLPTERGELPIGEGATTEGDHANVVGPVHGQPHTATVYRGESKSGSGAGLSALGAGKYYGLNEGVANRFSKSGTVQQQSVSLKNPIVLHSDEDMEKIKQQAEEETGLDFGKKGRMYSGMLLGDQPAAFTKWAKSKGYDGRITTYKEAPGGEQLLSFDDPASPPKTETPTANDETTAPAEDKPTIVGTGKTDDGGEVHFVPHSKQSDDETTIMVDPKKFDAAHRESDAFAVHPDGKNEVKGKREDIRKGMEKGGPMESPRATLDADGKPSVTDGRHRTRELTDMGLSHMGLTVPKEQAAEFQKRYGVSDGSEPQQQGEQTAADQSESSASAEARQEGQGHAKPTEEAQASHSVGDSVTYTGRGADPDDAVEFRGFHNSAETGEKMARVIFRPKRGAPYEMSVKPEELSAQGKPETPQEEPTKQPHEMTRQEFIDSRGANAEPESEEYANHHLSKVSSGLPGLSVEGNKIVYRDEDGQPVGVTTMKTAGGQKVVDDTAVALSHRRKGIASQMYAEAKKRGHDTGWVENSASAGVKHKLAVTNALAAGENVPAHVLADYPRLQPKPTPHNATDEAQQEGQTNADWKDTAAQYRHGGSATAGEAAHLKHTYDGLGEADRKEFAHHFGIDNAHKALPSTRDELVGRKIRELEFRGAKEVPDVHDGNLFTERGVGEKRSLFDDDGQAADAGLVNDSETTPEATPTTVARSAADGKPTAAESKEDLTDKAVDSTDKTVKMSEPTKEDSDMRKPNLDPTFYQQRPDESRDEYLKRVQAQAPVAKKTRALTKEETAALRADLRAAHKGIGVKSVKSGGGSLLLHNATTDPFAPDEVNKIHAVLRKHGVVDKITGRHKMPVDNHMGSIGNLVRDDAGPHPDLQEPTQPEPTDANPDPKTPPASDGPTTQPVEMNPTPTSTTTQEGQQATVTDQSPAPVPEAKDETPTKSKRKAAKASVTPQVAKPLSKTAAKSYATQLHHHWQQHQAGDAAHGKHYADALANLQQLPASDQDAVFAHADKLSGVNHRQPATPDAKAEAPKPAKTWDEGNDKHVAELLDRAYGHRRMFAENRDGLVEVPLLYHEMKKHMPDLSVARFHQELRKYQQHGNGGELHVLNEVHSAVDPHLALQGGDASDPRLYYYLRQHHNDGDILAPDAKPERTESLTDNSVNSPSTTVDKQGGDGNNTPVPTKEPTNQKQGIEMNETKTNGGRTGHRIPGTTLNMNVPIVHAKSIKKKGNKVTVDLSDRINGVYQPGDIIMADDKPHLVTKASGINRVHSDFDGESAWTSNAQDLRVRTLKKNEQGIYDSLKKNEKSGHPEVHQTPLADFVAENHETDFDAPKAHRAAVEQAIKAKRQIPADVLASYPDLAQKHGVQGVATVTEKDPKVASHAGMKPMKESVPFVTKLAPPEDLALEWRNAPEGHAWKGTAEKIATLPDGREIAKTSNADGVTTYYHLPMDIHDSWAVAHAMKNGYDEADAQRDQYDHRGMQTDKTPYARAILRANAEVKQQLSEAKAKK